MRAAQFGLFVVSAQISVPWMQFIPDLRALRGGLSTHIFEQDPSRCGG